MMASQNETPAAGQSREGQENQAPQRYQSQQIPSSAAWDLPLAQAREIAYAALRLYEGLEAEPWTASYHLEMRLQAFHQRIIEALQPAPAAESTASTPAEARRGYRMGGAP
jgi:hypothetical protein